MSFLVPILAGCVLLPAQADKPEPLRYLRPAKDRLVTESEVTVSSDDNGRTFTSRTDRGTEKMTLTLRFNGEGKLTSGEAVLDGPRKRVATLTFEEKGRGQLKRDGTNEFLTGLPDDPVVTTAPDWSDVFQLVRRYDATKGGKQDFPGLWVHPVQPMQKLTFSIQRIGDDTVTVKEKGKEMEVKLGRYRVKLRSGEYTVWADPDRRVVRIVPANRKEAFVVLQGYQEATRGLAP